MHTPDPARRMVGLETEFGISAPGCAMNPMQLSARSVAAYAPFSRAGRWSQAVRWDYEDEDPLADLRGGRLARDLADASLLTDLPGSLAPSVPASASDDSQPGGSADCWEPSAPSALAAGASLNQGIGGAGQSLAGGLCDWGVPGVGAGEVVRDLAAEQALPPGASLRTGKQLQRQALTNLVLANGGRFYVDHAHPEYSSPECTTPFAAMVWDRAGELIAAQAVAQLKAEGLQVHAYKNNVDGKGATWGAHENYLVSRALPLDLLNSLLATVLVTRQIVVGAGRVGLGERSEQSGFQISQRADYIHTSVGLQTTYARPLLNMRDEPHADGRAWRRIHVISGDANRFDVPILLKVGITNLALWLLETQPQVLHPLLLVGDVVAQCHQVSRDLTLKTKLSASGGEFSALQIQQKLLDAVKVACVERFGGLEASQIGSAAQVIELWQKVLDGLASDISTVADCVEWVAKYQLCQGLRWRGRIGWDHPRLAALDIQWGDVDGAIIKRLDAGGRIMRLACAAEVADAVAVAPPDTRAYLRGWAVANLEHTVGASWTSILYQPPGWPHIVRLSLKSLRPQPDITQYLREQLKHQGSLSGQPKSN